MTGRRIDLYNGPLRPYRVCVRVTGVVYVDVEGVNPFHAEGKALIATHFNCGFGDGSRLDEETGAVAYAVGEGPRPRDIRLDAVRNIKVESSTEL